MTNTTGAVNKSALSVLFFAVFPASRVSFDFSIWPSAPRSRFQDTRKKGFRLFSSSFYETRMACKRATLPPEFLIIPAPVTAAAAAAAVALAVAGSLPALS